MALLKDIWRIGLVRAPAESLLRPGGLERAAVHWLAEEGSLRFLADPFGLWRDERLFLFAEAYDYRDRKGVIDCLVLDEDFRVLERRRALEEAWHLSYPFVFEHAGETLMLPEAHRSGGLTLYRARAFPFDWEPVARIALDPAPIDATPVFHDGLWWLFHTPATTRFEKVAALHLAYAERLDGPWTPHPLNPVRLDPTASRPGGAPLRIGGRLVMPMQDCSRTYGGALRPLTVLRLDPEGFEAEAGAAVQAPASFTPYVRGLHTLSSAGEVALIDAKRQSLTAESLAQDLARRLKTLRRRPGG